MADEDRIGMFDSIHGKVKGEKGCDYSLWLPCCFLSRPGAGGVGLSMVRALAAGIGGCRCRRFLFSLSF